MTAHFRLAKCVKPATTERLADARVLPAPEGESLVINQGIVHPHLPGFDFFHGLHGFGKFGGKDVGVETELGAICQIDRLLETLHLADGRDGMLTP